MQGDTVACGGKNLPRAYGHHLGEAEAVNTGGMGHFTCLCERVGLRSPHLTTFVLPGHVVQDCSVVNKGIQFAVKRSRKKTFITQLERGSEGMSEDGEEARRCISSPPLRAGVQDDVRERWRDMRDEIITGKKGRAES